ncbi:MAG: disulfide oxidoreductase, partial [Inquilinus sp.]|nr:disulfide oxidoreductase [Inquilinus sp.]
NYDRVVRLKGRSRVALVTGEEKILPANPDYFVCTVESMPVDRLVEFLAIDEIQLCADPERGHVFTERLLSARGSEETMFLGAETIRPLLRRLVPRAAFETRARLSSLTHTGYRKLTRLPPRSAVVAFSAADVYETAELLRRQRGGTAVVLGALSPRTRNAQVDMYQAGEVDYLVATDAIGMGLNMDIDHVAFARLAKFDGRVARRLRATEVAQIAGRAGRHMADGTFGTTATAGALDEAVAAAVEAHEFEPLTALMWRNTDLDFRSPDLLLRSLRWAPPSADLHRSPEADDQLALAALARDPDLARLADNPAATRLLWEVCRIPDFRKVLSDDHTRMLGRIFRQLAGAGGRLDPDWVGRQTARLDRTDGDIDTLISRIAHTRTWTYIAHRAEWLDDPRHWQERARAIEDRLSDALHDRLTQRFVDRRATVLVRRLADGGGLAGAVTRSGEVLVEGEFVGRLDGFRFMVDSAVQGDDARALLSVARRALRDEIAARVRRFESDADDVFALSDDPAEPTGTLLWNGDPVARLVPGPDLLSPAVRPLPSELLEPAARDRVAERLQTWFAGRLSVAMAPLFRLRDAELTGSARGIAYQLVESLGACRRAELEPLLRSLAKADRRALSALGVRIGTAHVFLTPALKPRAIAMNALLWAVANRQAPTPPPAGCLSVAMEPGVPASFYRCCGYWPGAGRAVRLDCLERLAAMAARLRRIGPFAATPQLARLVGTTVAELPPMLALLGYRAQPGEDGQPLYRRPPARPGRRKGRRQPSTESPFAELKDLATRRRS